MSPSAFKRDGRVSFQDSPCMAFELDNRKENMTTTSLGPRRNVLSFKRIELILSVSLVVCLDVRSYSILLLCDVVWICFYVIGNSTLTYI